MNGEVESVQRLEASFPRWQVWQADTGEWWASVRRNLTPSQQRAGCVPYLRAESPDELERLMAQEDEHA